MLRKLRPVMQLVSLYGNVSRFMMMTVSGVPSTKKIQPPLKSKSAQISLSFILTPILWPSLETEAKGASGNKSLGSSSKSGESKNQNIWQIWRFSLKTRNNLCTEMSPSHLPRAYSARQVWDSSMGQMKTIAPFIEILDRHNHVKVWPIFTQIQGPDRTDKNIS